MIRTMFLRNLRHHGRLLAALFCGLAGFEVLIVWVASRIERGPGLRAFLELLMPPEAREAFLSQFGFATFAGAVAFGFQHPVSLVAATAGVLVAGTIPAGERETGFLELIASGPVRRAQYLAAALALVVVAAVLLPLGLLAGAGVGLQLVDSPEELPLGRYVAPAAGLSALLLALGAGALLAASVARRRGPAVARLLGAILALYVLEILSDLWEPLAQWRWLSPFHYFKPVPAALVPDTPVENPLVLLGLFAALSALALLAFRRQDF